MSWTLRAVTQGGGRPAGAPPLNFPPGSLLAGRGCMQDVHRAGCRAGQVLPVFAGALRDAIPIAAGIAFYGAVFGGLARQAGLSPQAALAMSLLVFSGSAQFVALPMLQAGTGPVALFLTAFLLGLRHLAMGLSLAPHLSGMGLARRCLLAYGLNDEAYALAMGHAARAGFSVAYLSGAALATFVSWMGGTALGALLGGVLPDPRQWGLDFAFPAVFLALLVPQVRGRAGVVATVAAVLTALAVRPLLGSGIAVLAGALVGAGMGGLLDHGS